MHTGEMLVMFRNFLIIIFLIFIMSSCKSPQFDPQIRRVWSVHFNECSCQWYDLNKVKVLSDEEKEEQEKQKQKDLKEKYKNLTPKQKEDENI